MKAFLGYRFFSCVLLLAGLSTYSREYLYPVASLNRNAEDYVYLIHQISLNQLQLLEWHVASSVLTQVVPAAVAPAGFKMLPDGSGYSFIDQGQLYIKLFSKRSAHKIDFPQTLYNVEMIEWVDATRCYFSAKYNGRYAIYDFNRLEGQLAPLAQSDRADCLYPQKINTVLYYIERSFDKKKYSIKQRDTANTLENDNNSSTIFDTQSQPIAFLYMKSMHEGYYVSYPALVSDSIDGVCTCLDMVYCQFYYDPVNKAWSHQRLFDFSIPLDMVLPDSKDRLHESLLPLLPRHTSSGIFYCSCGQSEKKTHDASLATHKNHKGTWYDPQFIALYVYNTSSRSNALVAHRDNSDVLSPICLGTDLLYGYSIAGKSKNRILLPGMWRNEYGQICYKVPSASMSSRNKA